MPTKLLLQAAQSQLVMIDLQVKLAPAMDSVVMQAVTRNCVLLLQAASLMQLQPIVTEQYPQGLGETLPELKQYLTNTKPIVKTAFSACAEPAFKQHLHSDKTQIVLTGMEAHICVLQTALGLLQANKQVFLVEDAVISRESTIKPMLLQGCVMPDVSSRIRNR